MENINTNDPVPNTTSCVSASPDVHSGCPAKAAKKRMRKAQRKAAAEAGLTGKAEGAESIALSGDTLAEAKARQIVIYGVQADAAYIAARLEKYTECVIAEDEARQKRIVFAETFRDPEVRKRCQNVRDFFATKKSPEYLLGKDGVTQYFTAPEYFRNEAGVTYEYIRRLDIRFKLVTHLLPDGTAQPPQPRTRQPRVSPSDSPSGKVNVDELPEDARKKVLAAISGTETTIDISPAESESDDAFTQEAPLTASVDERVQAAFAYVEANHARLMSLDEKEHFYFKLSKKFYDWDVPPSAPANDEFAEARKITVSEASDQSFEPSKSAPASRKNRKALIAAKVEARKNEKKNPAVDAIEKTLDATNAEQITVPDPEQTCDYSEEEVAAMFANGGK